MSETPLDLLKRQTELLERIANEVIKLREEQSRLLANNSGAQVSDINKISISFNDLVNLWIKVAFASIPAAILVTLFWVVFSFFIGLH